MKSAKKLVVLKRKKAVKEDYERVSQEIIEIEEECTQDVEMRSVDVENCNAKKVSKKTKTTTTSTPTTTITKPTSTSDSDNIPSTSSRSECELVWKDVQSAFRNRVQTGVIINKTYIDPKWFLDESYSIFKAKVDDVFKKEIFLKINTVLCCEFKITKDEEEKFEFKYFDTKSASLNKYAHHENWYTKHIVDPLLNGVEDLQEYESGWALSAIIDLTVNINKYAMLLGSSYIPLPKEIRVKRACINVRNRDHACFAWAIVSGLYPCGAGSKRLSKYPHYEDVLKLKGIKFPMTIDQIPRFERKNNMSINVFSLKLNTEKRIDNKYIIIPSYVSRYVKDKHINLLLIQNRYSNDDSLDCEDHKDVEPLRYHYLWIKDLSRLLTTQLSKHESKKYICHRCFLYFAVPEKLTEHMKNCPVNSAKICLPKNDIKNIRFKNYSKKKKASFVIYAGLECLFNETEIYSRRVPCNVAYFVKCCYDPTLSFYKSYRGDDCMTWLTRELEQFADDVSTVFVCDYPRSKLTKVEEKVFKNTKNPCACCLCDKPFAKSCNRVPNHCRFTGAYRGPAHEVCNMNYGDICTVPVFFYDLRDLDSYLLIEHLKDGFEGKIEIDVIKMDKRFVTFTKRTDSAIKLRFIDSSRFMNGTLDTLASYLDVFPIFRSQMSDITDEQFNLLTTKMVYPHSYVDSASKFEEITLPSALKFDYVTQLEYEHVKRLWKALKLRNLGEYSDLYLKVNVLLLADIFEGFRDICIDKYQLDPAHYHTLPTYSWDVMLRQTKTSLEILTDIDMVTFIERGTRGGLSQCSMRQSKANNIYLEGYISKKPSTYLMHFGVNELYSWAMSQHLPCGKFQWVEDFTNFDIATVPDDSLIGYVLEVDLEYPSDFHDLHKDLPFCPEYHIGPASKSHERLMATLHNKVNYVIHYRNLKLALKNGLVLTKTHRILQFEQSLWLKSYINLNRRLRESGKNNFERNLFEQMNCSVFEKFVENIRTDCKYKFATKWEGRFETESEISKPEFMSSKIINENLAILEFTLSEIYINKPLYVGMCIQDLAKIRLYEFHYEYMQEKFYECCSICYIDTDSILYEITSTDVYISMREDCEKQFDTSDYPYDNLWDIPRVNRKALGLIKDRNNSRVISEFVGLRSKMYAVKLDDSFKPMPFKGISKEVVASRIAFKDYANCLAKKDETEMSLQDSKRFVMKDGCETLPWGYFCLEKCKCQH